MQKGTEWDRTPERHQAFRHPPIVDNARAMGAAQDETRPMRQVQGRHSPTRQVRDTVQGDSESEQGLISTGHEEKVERSTCMKVK